MIEISAGELRADLNKYLRKVENGSVLVITHRGKAIARIVPAQENIEMDFIIDSGEVSIIWRGKPLSPWEPVAVNKGPWLVSDLVSQERR